MVESTVLELTAFFLSQLIQGQMFAWHRLLAYNFQQFLEWNLSPDAWRIPGTGKPGGLQSMGSHRVGHD